MLDIIYGDINNDTPVVVSVIPGVDSETGDPVLIKFYSDGSSVTVNNDLNVVVATQNNVEYHYIQDLIAQTDKTITASSPIKDFSIINETTGANHDELGIIDVNDDTILILNSDVTINHRFRIKITT